MGEYARLNKMLKKEQEKYKMLQEKQNKSDDEIEMMADLVATNGKIEF